MAEKRCGKGEIAFIVKWFGVFKSKQSFGSDPKDPRKCPFSRVFVGLILD
jgi:hypothetical protein